MHLTPTTIALIHLPPFSQKQEKGEIKFYYSADDRSFNLTPTSLLPARSSLREGRIPALDYPLPITKLL